MTTLNEDYKLGQVKNADSLRNINRSKRSSRYNIANKQLYSKRMSMCQEPQVINTSFIQENSVESDDPDLSRLSDNSCNRSCGLVKEPENYQSSFQEHRYDILILWP